MLRSGLILGVVALVLGFVATFISPLCAPCVALLAGFGAGYLAGVFDKPGDQGASAKSGASGGAIAGIGGLIGTMIAAGVNAAMVGPIGASQFMQQFGLPNTAVDPSTYYVSAIGAPCCIGLFDIALMAGLGALGGILWHRMNSPKTAV